jgi:hypothetical protein
MVDCERHGRLRNGRRRGLAMTQPQSHDRVDFPDGKASIVVASVGARVPAGVTNVVKGSSNHGHDWMSRYVH